MEFSSGERALSISFAKKKRKKKETKYILTFFRFLTYGGLKIFITQHDT